MTWGLLIVWAIGVTSFTLLGSLYARRFERSDLLVGLYVAFVLTAQVLATKMAVFNLGIGSFTGPAGVLVFSVTFLLTDIVNEHFGRKEAQRMIFIAFIAQMAMGFFIWLGVQFEADPMWGAQGERFNALFMMLPKITIASWIAFLVSENLDAYLYAWLKKLTRDRHLWLRNVLSTLPALAVDSAIFVTIAFWGAPIALLLSVMMGQIVVKWIIGVINIPFIYLNHAILTRGRHTPDKIVWESDAVSE
jgi:uncharacterized integral membrane protein (TIGR00697 family)